MEFNREIIIPIVQKINRLINIYAHVEKLEDFLSEDNIFFFQNISVSNNQNEPDNQGAIDWYDSQKKIVAVAKINFKDYIRSEAIHYNKKIDLETLSRLNSITGFVSDSQFLDMFQQKYYPEYLQMRNILVMLLYEMPRKINKDDFIILNSLYNKYKVDI